MSGTRIGQVSVYFGLFDDAMPAGFRQDREAFATRIRDLLAEHGEVVFPGLVDSEEAGRRVGEELALKGVDVVVFAPTMAAPPSYGWAAVAGLPVTPLVALGSQELSQIPLEYATEEATQRSIIVGLVMFTNVLVRQERPFLIATGHIGSTELGERLGGALEAAGAVAELRRARLGTIGAPIPGYLDIEVRPEELRVFGPEVIPIPIDELNARFEEVADEAVSGGVREARERFDSGAVDDAVLGRSVRLAGALEGLCGDHRLSGGAVNCHGDALRWNPVVGITACYGVSRLSEAGLPFACTGDLLTATALLLGKAIAGAALYCELYAMDLEGNWVLIANGGEGDLGAREPSRPVHLLPEDHYRGAEGPGTAVAFAIRSGPATLLSLSPAHGARGGWALVAAEGRILGSHHDAMESPNGMFRFDSLSVTAAYERWCRAGATHHAALLPGIRGRSLEMAADLLGIEFRSV